MEQQRKLFIGGNWKCNNTGALSQTLVEDVLKKLQYDSSKLDVVVAPVSLQVLQVKDWLKETAVEVAAQNCSATSFGAFTG